MPKCSQALSPRQQQRLQRIDHEARRLLTPVGTAPRPPIDGAPGAIDALREHHAGRRVVVAMHDAVLRELAVALLEQAGLRVVAASNGVEAFSLTLQWMPDLLLLDMEMPQRGAVAAARAIRTTVGSRLPMLAVVMAGPQEGGSLTPALDADLDDVITMPIDATVLYARVLAWLETGRCAT